VINKINIVKHIFLYSIYTIIICLIIIVSGGLILTSKSVLFNSCVLVTYIRTHKQIAFSIPEGWYFYRQNLACMLKPWKYFNQNETTICALNDTLKKLGIRLIVVPVPDKEAIIQKYSPVIVDITSKQRQRFITKLITTNINVLELTPLFTADNHKNQLFVKSDSHWDQRGISIAAELISNKINVMLHAQNQYKYVIKDTVIFEQGDLSMAMKDTTYYPRICKMILQPDSSVFCDSSLNKILIFGDSFTRANQKYCGHIGAHIAYFTHQPTFTYTPLQADPSMLLAFLRKHKNNLPEIIVWVFTSRTLFDKLII
jgi:hypothetical protein